MTTKAIIISQRILIFKIGTLVDKEESEMNHPLKTLAITTIHNKSMNT